VTPKALFFDFDGTILDTESVEYTSIAETFRAFGVEFDRARWVSVIGTSQPTDDFWIDWLEDSLGDRVDRMAINAQQRDVKYELLAHQQVRDGVVDLLKAADHAGIDCAVVSSSSRRWVEGNIERLGLESWFTMLVTREDAALAKPYPDLYLVALERHGVPTSDASCVVAFEDSHNGSLAAVRAGITTITCPNDMTAGMDFSHGHQHVNSLAEIDLEQLTKIIAAS
jgi:HAD superfamily hydrolase (TIGR01509 family)